MFQQQWRCVNGLQLFHTIDWILYISFANCMINLGSSYTSDWAECRFVLWDFEFLFLFYLDNPRNCLWYVVLRRKCYCFFPLNRALCCSWEQSDIWLRGERKSLSTLWTRPTVERALSFNGIRQSLQSKSYTDLNELTISSVDSSFSSTSLIRQWDKALLS